MIDVIEVVYVEDEEQEALVMRIGMRRQNVNILHIPDLSSAQINKLCQSPYNTAAAVIFDAVLPSASGLELAQALRAEGDARPVFLLTAGENPNPVLLETLQVEFIRKPAQFQSLAQRIREAL
ncbi:MAG: response regulator [Anaerolineae bacterium]|nr:response regulator [Anaerolineae bacterium]